MSKSSKLLVVLSMGFVCDTASAIQAPADALFLDGLENCRMVFVDGDGDGWGNSSAALVDSCAFVGTTATRGNDCNDNLNTIHPGMRDAPDPSYLDSDCDGIDGEIYRGVFVRTDGSDVSGDGSINSPFASPQFAVNNIAGMSNKIEVYVAGGNYNGTVSLIEGFNLYGSFGQNFQRDPLLATGSRNSQITGNSSFVAGDLGAQAVTLFADNIALPTTVEDLILVGPNAVGNDGAGRGKNSHVVIARISPGLQLINNDVFVGNGANGASGIHGNNAESLTPTAGMNGTSGIQGGESGSPRIGGIAGNNTCAAGSATNGGAGGTGGDTGGDFGGAATGGGPGGNGAQATGAFGGGGTGGPASGTGQAGNGGPGEPGRISNGSAGSAGSGGIVAPSGLWLGNAGGAGGIGNNGGGGGGGGGGGASDSGVDDFGSSGSGGSAGGCRAISGGGGGSSGGGSFGVYLINASPTITANSISGGRSGDGGNGGNGGQGQGGGLASNVVPGVENGGAGGAGGRGGHGGHGGGGGGGPSGVWYGIYRAVGSAPTLNANLITVGTAGTPGAGGISAPLAPAADDDGNDGAAGAAGLVGTEF